jgi:8-oxo-dGTP pyrophosphatase MutT (NUDIX family)
VKIQLGWSDSALAHRIAAIAAGQVPPVSARDAATVMVVRDGPDGVEALVLKRPASMKFAAGAYVFPGGSVDQGDYEASLGWQGPEAAEFGARLGAPPELARALVCAAVRETFEEAGVLLAAGADGEVVVPQGPSWEADRAALIAGELSLAGLLTGRRLVLRADMLTPWARWITPEAEPRRFDAWFFAAVLPTGQRATPHAAEVDAIGWVRPRDALAAARSGEMSLLPPTAATLAELAAAVRAADVARRKQPVTPICPVLHNESGQAWLEVPDHVGYPL